MKIIMHDIDNENTSILAQIRLPRSQTQAMRLILDYVKSKHYFYQSGWIRIEKLPAFVAEMQVKLAIGGNRISWIFSKLPVRQ